MPAHGTAVINDKKEEEKKRRLMKPLTLVGLLSLHGFEVDGGHGRDHLHGLCFHQTQVLPVPTSPLQEQPVDQDPLLEKGGEKAFVAAVEQKSQEKGELLLRKAICKAFISTGQNATKCACKNKQAQKRK